MEDNNSWKKVWPLLCIYTSDSRRQAIMEWCCGLDHLLNIYRILCFKERTWLKKGKKNRGCFICWNKWVLDSLRQPLGLFKHHPSLIFPNSTFTWITSNTCAVLCFSSSLPLSFEGEIKQKGTKCWELGWSL